MNIKRILALSVIIGFLLIGFSQAGVIINYPKFMALSSSTGRPLVGGKLHTYMNGTTTSKATYTTKTCTVANTNPVVLDSRGEAVVYGIGTYTFVLKTFTGTTIWTADDIQGLPDEGTNYYYPDSTEANQGAAGLGASAKAYIDLITTKNAGIFFKQGSAVSGTTYTFSTSLTFPANVELFFDKGAIMNVASGVTVTVYSPANFKNVIPNQRIKAGAGALIYTVPYGIKYDVWEGSVLSQTSLSLGFDLIPSGDTTYNLGSGTTKWNYTYTHNLQLESGVSVNGISSDTTLANNSTAAIPTENAVKSYVDLYASKPTYYKHNLKVTHPGTSGVTTATSAYCVAVTADELTLSDLLGNKIILSGVSNIANITVAGANGLEVGSTESGTTTLYIWIAKYYGGTTNFALLSYSSTTPLAIPTTAYKRCVGEVQNDASSNFVLFRRDDDRVRFIQAHGLAFFTNTTLKANYETFTIPAPVSAIEWTSIDFVFTKTTESYGGAVFSGTTNPAIPVAGFHHETTPGIDSIYFGEGYNAINITFPRVGSATTMYIRANYTSTTGVNARITGYVCPR